MKSRPLQNGRSGFRQKAGFFHFPKLAALCRDAATVKRQNFMNSKLKLIFVWTLLVAAVGLNAFIAGCSRQPATSGAPAASSEKTLYTCGMHPWIIQDHPG